jgi:hypothetical protein
LRFGHVFMTFLTGNDLKKKMLKKWQSHWTVCIWSIYGKKLFCTNHLQILHRLSRSRHFLNTYGYKLKNFQSDFSLPRVLWKRLFVYGCHNIKSHCTSVDLGPLGAQSCEFHSFSLLHQNSV